MTHILNTDPKGITETESSPAAQDMNMETFHDASFEQGSLGITLQLNSTSFRCYVLCVNEGSQAVEKDVQAGDELWEVNGGSFWGRPL